MTPTVSVIIPCRGADRFLPLQLEALRRQHDAPEFEVVLSDNGLNTTLETFTEDPRVRVIDATRSRGTAYARNVGIDAARADLLLFCDADDVVGPTWVRDGAAALERHEAFSGGAIPMTDEVRDAGLETVWTMLADRLPDYCSSDSSDFPLGTYPILLGCSFGARRYPLMLAGLFDNRFRGQAEDNDLAFRLQRRLGTLPREAGVAVAYRTRPDSEVTARRSFAAGYRHAAVCERHRAWDLSPSYAGHWLLRPMRQVVTGDGLSRATLDTAARVAGLALGRVRYR